MFFTSRKQYFTHDAREINIGENCKLPQLNRLCSDFGFAVIGFNESSATPKNYVLCEVGLVRDSKESPKRVSPKFISLAELEAYTAENMVEIVQKYLFGDDTASDAIAVA